MSFTPELLYGVRAVVLLSALVWGMLQYKTRNRANDPVTDEAAHALFDDPKTYDEKRPELEEKVKHS